MTQHHQQQQPAVAGGKKKQKKGAVPIIAEATRIRFTQIVNEFSDSNDEVYTFEPDLTSDERAVVHSLARKRGLKSKSYGVADQRRISVFNNKKCVETVKDKIFTSFKFSEESKHVLRDLFTRYPPNEHEMSEKADNKPIGKSEKRKKDTFFCKPSFRREHIVKKLTSLASEMEKNPKLRQINEARTKLPITKFKDIITSTIESNQVVLISGETGCGKTTQVPQYLLDHMWGKGEKCKIVCTQPRRISAISVSERIASERGETVGATVGYKIRLEKSGGANSSIVFCTNGVLLRVLVSTRSESGKREVSGTMTNNVVSGITHIIVDEIHERDRFSDLMLAILRDMLPSYPRLRLVLMSATLDAERFSQYFGGCPIIRVPGFTYPVKSFYLEDVLTLLNLTTNKQAIEEEKDLLDKYLSTSNPEEIDIDLIENLLKRICSDTKNGAILVFLSGWDHINKTRERLEADFFKDSSKFAIISLHSMVPSIDQRKVFIRPPKGRRKIVLSTNIAETSVTIDDVVYVIDTGRMKEKNYDPYNNVSTLNSSWISKASAKQREGRAGRCQPGVCYHLYSKNHAASLIDFQIPEIRRIPIEELCLQVKILDPDCEIDEFLQKTLDPPISETIQNAIRILQDIGALSSNEKLTDLGKKIGSLPVHPLTSKMLFVAILTSCLDPALTLACASDCKDAFIVPLLPNQKKKVTAAKSELSMLYGGYSDQLAIVAAFEGWRNANAKGEAAKFCSSYYVSAGTMRMLLKMREQLEHELERHGFLPNGKSVCSVNARDPGVLRAVLVADQYPMVGRLLPNNGGSRCIVETPSGNKVRLHPQSTNLKLAFKKDVDRPLIVHDEVTRVDSGLIIKNCSLIGTLPLLMLATEIIVVPARENDNENGSEDIMSTPDNTVKVIVDRWLSLESTAIDVAQIYCLRERLSNAIMHKVTHPREVLPDLLGASMKAITATLSTDGMLGVRPTPTVTVNAKGATRGSAQNPSQYLEALISGGQLKRSARTLKEKAKQPATKMILRSAQTPKEKAKQPAPKKMKNVDHPSKCPSRNSPAGAFPVPSQNLPEGGLAGPNQICPAGAFVGPMIYPDGMFAGYQITPTGIFPNWDKRFLAGTLKSCQLNHERVANVSQIPTGGATFPSENLGSSAGCSLKRRRDDES